MRSGVRSSPATRSTSRASISTRDRIWRAASRATRPLTRRNAGCHWVAVPGDYTDPGALPDPGRAICLGTPGGILIALSPQGVLLGSATASQGVALGPPIDAGNVLLEAFAKALGAVPPTGALVPLSEAIAAASALAGGIPATVTSGTVKTTP